MKKCKSLFYSLILVVFLTGLAISDNLSVAHNAEFAKHRVGAKCCDGWNSTATGRGACSHHGGVKYWKYSDGSVQYTGRCD